MNRKILFLLAVMALLGASALAVLATTSVQAKKDTKPVRAKIEWSQPRIQAQVKKGATIQTTLTFTPTVNLTNASFRVAAAMQDTVAIEPSSFATLTAGTPTQVQVTFTAPTEGKHKKFRGIATLIDENYLFGRALKLRFNIVK